jgi:polysaccharide deacetylase 2 family uncharacterized protein YibQ
MTRSRSRLSAAWRRRSVRLRLAIAGLAVLVAGAAVVGLIGREPAPGHRNSAVHVPIAAAPSQPPAAVPSKAMSEAAPAQPVDRHEADRHDEPQEAALAVPRLPPSSVGEPPWIRYAVAPPPIEGRAMVAVVIDDLGLDRKGTEEAIRLPPPLTLSFMTYANDLARTTAAGHAAGHELLLHVPMEAIDPHQDPGPNGLLTGLSRDEILRRLRWGLDRTAGYVGINNHMGSKFTSSAESMEPVLEEMKARGLLFLDSRTIASSVGEPMARQMGVPHAARDVFLDYEMGASAIAARLAEVEQVAHRRGSAIAIGHPHEVTLAALAAWLPTLAEKHLVLVPLSAVVRQRDATG